MESAAHYSTLQRTATASHVLQRVARETRPGFAHLWSYLIWVAFHWNDTIRDTSVVWFKVLSPNIDQTRVQTFPANSCNFDVGVHRHVWMTWMMTTDILNTGCRRLIGSLIFTKFSRKSDLYLVALLWKMICNSGDPMNNRHPVIWIPEIFSSLQIYDKISSWPTKQQKSEIWMVQEFRSRNDRISILLSIW